MPKTTAHKVIYKEQTQPPDGSSGDWEVQKRGASSDKGPSTASPVAEGNTE